MPLFALFGWGGGCQRVRLTLIIKAYRLKIISILPNFWKKQFLAKYFKIYFFKWIEFYAFEHHTIMKLEASTWGFKHHILMKLEASTWGFEHHTIMKLEASTWGFEHHTIMRLEASTWGFEHHTIIKLEASTWGFEHHIVMKLEASTWGFEHHTMMIIKASTWSSFMLYKASCITCRISMRWIKAY